MATPTQVPTPVPAPMRPPRGLVLRELPPESASAEVDWTRWYLTDEEDMGSSPAQQAIIWLFLSCLKQLAFERQWTRQLISTDVFFAWNEEHPLVRVSPDVFVLDDPPSPLPRSFQTWQSGHHAPRFALEVVSIDWQKDYVDAPEQYQQLGCGELVVFDPDARTSDEAQRKPLTVYKRASDGALQKTYSGSGPAYSAELNVWLVVVKSDDEEDQLRLARDSYGLELVPTEAEQAQIEAARARAEAEHARTEARARADAEARIRELEEQLRKLKGD